MNSLYWYGENWIKGAPQYIELEQEYSNLKQKYDNIKLQHEELIADSLKIQSEKNKLQIRIDEITTENNFNKNINDEILRKERNMLISEINELNDINKEQKDLFLENETKLNQENQKFTLKIKDIEDEKKVLENENKNLKSIINKLKEQTENIFSRNEELEIELLSYRTTNRQHILNINKNTNTTTNQIQSKAENSTQTVNPNLYLCDNNTNTEIDKQDKGTQKFPSFINTELNEEIFSTQSSPDGSDRFSVKPFLENLDETLVFPNKFKPFNTSIEKLEFPIYSEDDGECLIKKKRRSPKNPYDLEEMNEFNSESYLSSDESDFEL